MPPRAALLLALLLAGCAAPGGPATPTSPGVTPTPTASPIAAPSPTPPATAPLEATPSPSTPAPQPPPPEPTPLPDENRTFELRLPARDPTDHAFLVNATDRMIITLAVRNAQPVARDFGASVLAQGPNGTRQQDSGQLPDGGAAFALRLAPLGLSPSDGPALVRVRVSATVPVIVEGRIDVDDDVPTEGGSTVP